jgi:hypothetical protein
MSHDTILVCPRCLAAGIRTPLEATDEQVDKGEASCAIHGVFIFATKLPVSESEGK